MAMTVCVYVSGCTRRMDVVIVLDLSGSIEEVKRYGIMVELARLIAAGLPVASGNARVGAVTYDTNARSEFYLSTFDRNIDAVLNAFHFNRARGTTNTQASLNLARTDQVYITLLLTYSFHTLHSRNETSCAGGRHNMPL